MLFLHKNVPAKEDQMFMWEKNVPPKRDPGFIKMGFLLGVSIYKQILISQ